MKQERFEKVVKWDEKIPRDFDVIDIIVFAFAFLTGFCLSSDNKNSTIIWIGGLVLLMILSFFLTHTRKVYWRKIT